MGLPETPWPPIVDGEDEDQGVPSPEPPTVLPALCPPEDVLSAIYRGTDVVQETLAAGVCGLRNLGNTCFMNAGLQCLLSNAHLLGFLLSFPEDWPSDVTRSPIFLTGASQSHESLLVWHLAQLAQQVWSGRFAALRPVSFKDALANACPQFSDYRQHDCQEFLTLLLDTLHEQTNAVNFSNGTVLPFTQKCSLQNWDMRLPSRSFVSKYSEARESMVSGEEAPDVLPHPSCKTAILEGTFLVSNGQLEPDIEENVGPAPKRFKSDNDTADGVSAEEAWEKYKAANRSVVVDTFQGQLQSKVVCSECGHVSLTYEPFMYLPVPLPHAMEMHISVTYVPLTGPRLRCLVQVGRVGRVGQLCGSLEALLDPKDKPPHGIALAHVSPEDSVIERFLEDHLPVRYLEDGGRLVYAFALGPAPEESSPPPTFVSYPRHRSWQTCAICLEEKADNELRTHLPCGGLLCYACVQVACEHYGNSALVCPVCNASLLGEQEFVSLSNDDPATKDRPVMVSVLLCGSDSNPPTPEWRVPALVRVPRCASHAALQAAAATLVPEGTPVTLCLLDARGRRCKQCHTSKDCKGCPLEAGLHTLLPSDCLAVRCQGEAPPVQLHSSVEGGEIPRTLSLNDCVKAFCESETLDEDNHWLCPICCRHRRARKTLSLWRLPKTLMVYLKRFVFQESYGSKLEAPVEFPLAGLDLCPFLRGPFGSQEGGCLYDLHAFVCHFGDVNCGHYTAYARHSILGRWFHYDDEMTGPRTPTAGDCQHAYVLFYQQKGSTNDVGKGFAAMSPAENVNESLDSTPGSAALGLHSDTFQNILRHLEDCPPPPSSSL
ncbi:ubiquitin carboxyl-terminal hydrolase 4-like [Ornithodoros turicata]|uniref:ubiquitin carboxyl-terminal hydrolase 4-like n=1 Tax=Ornithodoros turicata TaxID=34597 RepID=UPI0031399A18